MIVLPHLRPVFVFRRLDSRLSFFLRVFHSTSLTYLPPVPPVAVLVFSGIPSGECVLTVNRFLTRVFPGAGRTLGGLSIAPTPLHSPGALGFQGRGTL